MEDLIIKIMYGCILGGGIGLCYWQIKKNNGYEEKLREETRKDVKTISTEHIEMKIKFEIMEKNWEKYDVEKAYASAKRSHFRLDELESKT